MVDILKITCCMARIIGIALVASSKVELTNEFIQCSRSDPKLYECLKESLQNVIPNLVEGIPTLEILPIDPFRITSMEIDQGTGPVNIRLSFRDLNISNIGTAKITNVNADLDKNNITLEVDFEKPITLDGNYDVKGKVMILPIIGNGKSKISLDDVRAKIYAYLKTVLRNGNTYVEIQQLSLKFTTSRMHIKLDNLFNGDKALENNMNTFLNENWEDILGGLQSSIENALATIISEVAKQVFIRVPLNKILKE